MIKYSQKIVLERKVKIAEDQPPESNPSNSSDLLHSPVN